MRTSRFSSSETATAKTNENQAIETESAVHKDGYQ